MIRTLIMLIALCSEPEIINFTNEAWGSPADLRVLKRAKVVCKERYDRCVKNITKKEIGAYLVVCGEVK